MPGPKVSVVMAVYNSEKYLKKALASVFSQTLREIEIICVDDGSADASLSILEEAAKSEPRMKILRHTEPTDGAGAARNLGMAAATGTYLSILDADDFFEPDMLEKAYARAEEKRADIVLYDSWLYEDGSGRDEIVGWILLRDNLPDQDVFSAKENAAHIFQMGLGSAWHCFFRRDFVEHENLQFESIHHADDLGFVYLAFACAKRITVVDEKLMHYRRNNAGSQSANLNRWPLSGYEALLRLKAHLEGKHLWEEFKESFAFEVDDYMKFYLEALDEEEPYLLLYQHLKDGGLQKLGMDEIPKAVRWGHLAERICQESPVSYLLHRYQRHEQAVMHPVSFPRQIYAMLREKAGSHPVRLALYGAGEQGQTIFSMFAYDHFPVCTWVDRNYQELGYPVESPDRLLELSYDFVLVTPRLPEIYASIRRDLQSMGIPAEKILWAGEC